MGPKCKRCGKYTYDCPICKGTGRFSHVFVGTSRCTECNGTTQLCPQHGKYWSR